MYVKTKESGRLGGALDPPMQMTLFSLYSGNIPGVHPYESGEACSACNIIVSFTVVTSQVCTRMRRVKHVQPVTLLVLPLQW